MNYATGFAIFDPGGKLWAAGHRNISPPSTVLAAEITVIIDGITFWKGQTLGSARILSDSTETVNAIRTNSPFLGIEEDLISQAKLLATNTSVKGVWYCPRANNTVAHNLAKDATTSPLPQAWVGDDLPRRLTSLALDLH